MNAESISMAYSAGDLIAANRGACAGTFLVLWSYKSHITGSLG